MLSAESAALVRATLPAVGGGLDEITAPLLRHDVRRPARAARRDLFNRGNQATGAQRQALAGSIAAFAAPLVEHPDARPDAMLARIAHKHASLGVTDDQYTIVHKHLFGAIAEVLGDAVTPEVAAAWDEVYWLMAGALIALEARLYQDAGVDAGRRLAALDGRRAASRRPPTSSPSCSRPADGGPAPALPAGPVRQRPRRTARRRPPDPPVQPLRRAPARRAAADHRQAGHGRRPAARTARSPTCCTTHVRDGDELPCPRRSATWSSTTADAPAAAGLGRHRLHPDDRHAGAPGRPPAPPARSPVLHADRSPADHALRAETTRPGRASCRAPEPPSGTSTRSRRRTRRPHRPDGPRRRRPAGRRRTPTCAGRCPSCAPYGPAARRRGARRRIRYEVFGPDLWLPGSAV